MTAYLDKHGIPYAPRATKVELLALAREHADKSPKFAVTEIAAKYGFEIIYTPPYVRSTRLPKCVVCCSLSVLCLPAALGLDRQCCVPRVAAL